MVLKDWKRVSLDKVDLKNGTVAHFYNKKGGKKPPYTESIYLNKYKDKRAYPFHLVGGYWDLVFQKKNEAMAWAIDYMKRH